MKSMFTVAITFCFFVYNVQCAVPKLPVACPRDRPLVNCLAAPCSLEPECPAYPNATCRDNYCGGCFADFYHLGKKVDCCDFFCVEPYDPVCGSDGKTYSNKCQLERVDCKNAGKIYLQHCVPCYCLLPAEVGPCRAHIPRYYYDNQAGECKLFYYGGCEGNKNNFDSKKKCEAKCNRIS